MIVNGKRVVLTAEQQAHSEELRAKLRKDFQPAIDEITQRARDLRIHFKTLIISISDPSMRADSLRNFGWTERDLDEVRVVQPLHGLGNPPPRTRRRGWL